MTKLQQAQTMRNAFCSREVWDQSHEEGRRNIVCKVIDLYDDGYVFWSDAREMLWRQRHVMPFTGNWDHSYDHMLLIFDTMLKLAKLQMFR